MPSDKAETRQAAKALLLELSEYRHSSDAFFAAKTERQTALEDIVIRHLQTARREALEDILALDPPAMELSPFRQAVIAENGTDPFDEGVDTANEWWRQAIRRALATPAAEEPTNAN
jgi:hypothetical protein